MKMDNTDYYFSIPTLVYILLKYVYHSLWKVKNRRAKLLINITEGALNIMKLKKALGLNTVLTPKDMISLLECQVTPLPPRKSPEERRQSALGTV